MEEACDGEEHANFTRVHGQERERKQLVCNRCLKGMFLVI